MYIDKDDDNYDAGQETVCFGNTIPAGYKETTLGTDCDDNDASLNGPETWYYDYDEDGHYIFKRAACSSPGPGWTKTVGILGDCDDNNATIHQSQTWYLDADNDGYYVNSMMSCGSPGTGWNTTGGTSGDCDDNNASVWQSSNLYIDNDGDGYTAGQATVCYGATIPAGYSSTTSGIVAP